MTLGNDTGARQAKRWAVALIGACALGTLVGAGLPAAWLIGPGMPGRPDAIRVEAPRVIVLKSRRLLFLMDGDRTVRTYPIDLGTSPIGDKRCAGDGRTPEGRFRIVTRNAHSQYHRFLGISYPQIDDVRRGASSGLLTSGEAATMLSALEAGDCPAWGTLLGGGIGIHGHGKGSDWTAGCIAVADAHIEELFGVLRLGDPVEVLP